MKSKASPHERHNFLSTILAGSIGLAIASVSLPSAHAQVTRTWDGGAGTNVLNTGANWSDDTAPTVSGDTALWDGTQAGDLSLVWSGNFGSTTNGLELSLAATQIGSVTLDATSGNLSFHSITLAAGAGAFTLGDGAGSSTVVFRGVSPHTFTNDSASTATWGADLAVNSGAGTGRSIGFTGTGNWQVNSNLNLVGVGTLTLTKSSSGTLTLNGVNDLVSTTISGGIVHASNGAALRNDAGTSTVNIGNAPGTRLRLSNSIALAGVTTFNLTGDANAPSNLLTDAAIENLSGNNEIQGTINFNNTGGTNVNLASTSGTLTLSGSLSSTLSGVNRTFNFFGAGDTIVSGFIMNGSALSVGLFKHGPGTLTLSNTNTYTGPTIVNAGTLLVGGSISGSATTVDLLGSISAGNSLSSIGSGAIGSLSLAGTATLRHEFSISSAIDFISDVLTVNGDLNLSGAPGLSLVNLGLDIPLDPGSALTLLDYGGVWNGGFFNDLPDDTVFQFGPNALQISYNGLSGADTAVTLMAVPEPTSSVLLLGALGIAGLRRRPVAGRRRSTQSER